MWASAKAAGYAPGRLLRGKGIVETVFSRAVNIRLDSGFCVSLVEDTPEQAPNRIIVPRGTLQGLSFRPNESATLGIRFLRYKDHTIQFTPSSPQEHRQVVPTYNTLKILRQALENGKGPCLTYLGLADGGFIDRHLAGLARALSSSLRASFDFIGLGYGYTPSGDDFLVGYTAVEQQLGMLDRGWHSSLVTRAFRTTTSLSATALYFAGLGQVQGYLANVLEHLTDLEHLPNSCTKLIEEVGTTSGSDLLFGVFIACTSCLFQQRRDEHHA